MEGHILTLLIFQCSFLVCCGTEASTIQNKNETSSASTEMAYAATEATSLATAITAATAIPTTTRRPLLQGLRMPCSCLEGQCGCCTGMILERFKQKACMNFTYEPDDFAITASMSMNGRVLYKNSFSGKNPPPMCIRVPRFRFIKLCVEFSNVYLAKRNIHMCVDAEASWEQFTLVEWSFDCIRMGASGVAVIGPEDGGGLPLQPVDAEDQVDEDYDDSARNVPLSTTNLIRSKEIPIKVKRLKAGIVEFIFQENYQFDEPNLEVGQLQS